MMVHLVLKHFPHVFLIVFFSVSVAVHPISVHVSGGQGSAVGIWVF